MITNTTAKMTYTFTEGITEYAVGFVYDTNPDGTPQLKVYKNKLIGAPLVYGTDYTMSLDGTNVVISSGVEVGETFTIIRDIPPVQLSDYVVGRIDPEQIERDMDLAVMRDQQMLAEVDVAISIPADHEERIEAIEDVIPSTATDENKLATQADIPIVSVSSVNSMIGAVVLDASDVGAATTAQGAKADTAVQPGDLAAVATSGSYNDLSNKPTIPTAQVNSDWNANSGVAQILNKPTLGTMASENASDYTPAASLATVATSGSYNDLIDKPTDLGDIEYATYGVTTYQQIKAWHDAGKLVVCKSLDGQQVRPLVSLVSTGARFGAAIGGVSSYVYLYQVSNENVWLNSSKLIQTIMQWSVMPIPSITYAGEIVQYVGGTDANYTKGYFYTCVLNNTVYSWEQIDVQPNGSGGGHEVIAFQAPTADNDYTWYRKYADGWVEQGGKVQLNGAISATNKRVTFPVVMATDDYFAIASQDANTPYTSFVGWQSTTGMSVGTNGASTTGITTWLVSGMAA